VRWERSRCARGWIGFFWVLILAELVRLAREPRRVGRSLWCLAALLSVAAYVHYEAVISYRRSRSGFFFARRAGPGFGRASPLALAPLRHELAHTVASLTLDSLRLLLWVRLHAPDGDAVPSPRAREHVLSNPYLAFHSLFLWLGSRSRRRSSSTWPGDLLGAGSRPHRARPDAGALARAAPALGRVAFWTCLLSLVVKARGLVHDSLPRHPLGMGALELILERDEGGVFAPLAHSPVAAAATAALSLAATFIQQLQTPSTTAGRTTARGSIASSARRRSRRKARSPSASGSRTCPTCSSSSPTGTPGLTTSRARSISSRGVPSSRTSGAGRRSAFHAGV